MHEMTLTLPSAITKQLQQEAEERGLSFTKHLLATLDKLATTKSKELINDSTATKRRTTE